MKTLSTSYFPQNRYLIGDLSLFVALGIDDSQEKQKRNSLLTSSVEQA